MTAALILTSASHTIACASCNAPWPREAAQCPGCGRREEAPVVEVSRFLCARCDAPWWPGVERCAECDRRAANTPEAQLVALRAQLAAVTAERDALRAIVEGRTMPPTPAEIVAHEATGGYFLFRDHDETGRVYDADCLQALLDDAHRHLTRWWAHDANDAPCAWPTVPA